MPVTGKRLRAGGLGAVGWLVVASAVALSHANPAAAASPPAAPKPVVAWGTNWYGEAGNGGGGDQSYCCDGLDAYNDYPVQAQGLAGAIAVSASGVSSAAIVRGQAADGSPDPAQNTVWTWGDDTRGQLGTHRPDVCLEPYASPAIGRYPCAKEPVEVRGPGGSGFLTGIVAIADGGDHVLALRDDGTVWAWGDDALGEVGLPPPPAANPACPDYVADDGVARIGDPWCVPYPVQVPGLAGVTAIAAAGAFTGNIPYSLAIVHQGGPGPDDTVWAWGDNTAGELGQGWDCRHSGPCSSPAPAPVPGLTGVTALSTGAGTVMAIVRGVAGDGSDNQLWTWGGDNRDGASGVNVGGAVPDPPPYTNSFMTIDRPTRVLDSSGTGDFTGAIAVATSGGATVALKYEPAQHTTTVWNWGADTPAASGTPGGIPGAGPGGPTHIWTTPRQVRGAGGNGFLTGAVAVAHVWLGAAYVLFPDGSVWGWGFDDVGQLGWPGSTIRPDGAPYSTFPIQVRGITGATAIAAGYGQVLALADTPPPAPPVVKQPQNPLPPVQPLEQAEGPAAPLQPQPPATVPVVNPGVVPSTVNPPPQGPLPGGGVASQPITSPVQSVLPVHAPTAQMQSPVQGSQLVAGGAPAPGSPGALAPSTGDRPAPTDQLAMLRHDDTADTLWAIGIGGAAAVAFIVCVVATARSRRPPSIRPAAACADGRRYPTLR